MSYSDPRCDDIAITMQQGIDAGKTPTEVLATALADIYRLGVEDASKEHDELRAQVALLRSLCDQFFNLPSSAVTILTIPKDHTKLDATQYSIPEPLRSYVQQALRQTPAEAAAYVRGLEDALREIGGNFACKCSQQQKCQRHIALEALAAKDKTE